MAIDIQEPLQEYIRYYESMTPESVEELIGLATKDIHFRDPFNDLRGVEKVIEVMHDMFRDTIDPQFKIIESFEKGETALLKWEMTFIPKKMSASEPWFVVGFSELKFNEEGKVYSHIDYWDAATYFYERIPLIGFLIRLVKKRLAVS